MSVSLGDCEAVGRGLLAQPTNSLSSVAFAAVGVWLGWRSAAQPRGARWPGAALAVVLVANGVGSVWYHGRAGDAGHWLHDVAALALPLLIIVVEQARRHGRGAATALTAFGAALVVLGLVEVVWPDDTNTLVLTLLLALVASEAQAARQARRAGEPAVPAGHPTAKVVLVAALVLAGLGVVLGRSGSVTCRRASTWQFHSLWHVAVAIAAGAYAVGVLEPRTRDAALENASRVGPRR